MLFDWCERDSWAATGSSVDGCRVSRLVTLQEVPDQKWRERYTEGQKLRARIIYVDANSKKVSTWCGGPQTECTCLVPLLGSAWSGELQPCLSISAAQ